MQHDHRCESTRTASAVNAKRIVAMAVLQRDVAEGKIGAAVGHADRAAVGDRAGLQSLGPTELGDGLAAALEERCIEIAGDDAAEQAA